MGQSQDRSQRRSQGQSRGPGPSRSQSQSLRRRVGEAMRRPEFIDDLLQILKCVVAATAAWWFAVTVLESELPFLAPWTALLAVHATVYRSLSAGAQTSAASGIGVLLSFLVGNYLGVSLWTFALALLVGMTASRLTWIRDEGVAIATTAIFVLGSGFENQEHLLTDRVVEVLVGVGFGLAVNLMIIPPLRDRQAARHIDSINRRMGAVLEEMAQEFSDSWEVDRAEEWFQEVSEMGDAVQLAWRTVSFARESSRANPRWYIHALRRGEHDPRQLEIQGEEVGYEELLQRVDESISHLAELTRTLRDASYAEGEWDTVFRERWARIVRDAGRVIADPDAEVEPVKHRLDDLAVHMSQDEKMPDDAWPLYGSLIMSMRSIAVIVDDVASAREARTAARENPTP